MHLSKLYLYILTIWQKNMCILPDDLKNFFLTTNGLLIQWSIKFDGNFKVMDLKKMKQTMKQIMVRKSKISVTFYMQKVTSSHCNNQCWSWQRSSLIFASWPGLGCLKGGHCHPPGESLHSWKHVFFLSILNPWIAIYPVDTAIQPLNSNE